MTWLNTLASQWWPMFALHMIEIALFLALIAALERVFKLNVTTRYALWLLGLAKVFIPPVIALPATFTESMPAALILPSLVASNSELARELPAMSVRTLLFCLWLLSAFLFFGLMIKRHVNLQRRLQSATALPPFPNMNCAAFETEAITSPVLLGLFQPKLYLPREWRDWSTQHLQSILQHEAAHMHGRDLYILALESLALVLFGLNPLVWLMRRRLTYLRELRCDFAAIARTGISALDYSKLLYAFAERQAQPVAALAAGIPFAEQQSTLYQRLQHLLTRKESDMNANKFGRITLLSVMGAMLLVFSWQCSGPMQVDKTPLAPQTQSESAAPSSDAQFDTPPEIVTISSPNYPEAAKEAKAQGLVFVQMEIDTEGNVAEAKVVKSRKMTDAGTEEVAALGYGLEEAALTAARTMKFKPAQKNGKPVPAAVTMPFNFKLDDHAATPSDVQQSASSFDEAPRLLNKLDIKLPENMPRSEKAQRVFAQVTIGTEGETESVTIVNSQGCAPCEQVVAEALRGAKWKPAKLNGKPVVVTVTLPVELAFSN